MRSLLIVPAALFVTLMASAVYPPAPPVQAQVQVQIGIPVPMPYFYSPAYCDGCWFGTWGGREGYHRGGGEPWSRDHYESDHYRHDGQYHGGHNQHEGHR